MEIFLTHRVYSLTFNPPATGRNDLHLFGNAAEVVLAAWGGGRKVKSSSGIQQRSEQVSQADLNLSRSQQDNSSQHTRTDTADTFRDNDDNNMSHAAAENGSNWL